MHTAAGSRPAAWQHAGRECAKAAALHLQADTVAPSQASDGADLAGRPSSAAAGADDGEGQAGAAGSGGGDGAPEGTGREAGAAGDGDADAHADAGHAAHPFGFPLTLIKRVMCLDPDVSRVTADGLKAVAKAAELVLELLAEKAAAQARARSKPPTQCQSCLCFCFYCNTAC